MEDNKLRYYDQIKEVPKEAQKPIGAGRLKGMTDINPMWRIKKLTELFGPAGIGWYTETIKEEVIEGSNNEQIVRVDINLYVKEGNEWSKPIFGTGGSKFVTQETKGLYTSDECFKMAYTDALSVSCKALGMGADVYWGDSKYNITSNEPASDKQIELLRKIFKNEETLQKMLDKYELDSLEDISKSLASDIIKKNLGDK